MKSSNSLWVAASILLSVSAWSGQTVKVTGTVDGFTGLASDNLVDGAIVLPSLSADDLFQFQIDEFMGPSETMTVGGLFSADVPSNFYFPKQTEWWGLFPVSFNKDTFSIYVAPGDKRELVAAWFQLPFDKMVQINQNHEPNTDMLPYLTIKKHGFLPENDWSTVNDLSINLDRDLGPKLKYSWQRNAISGTDMDSLFVFQGTETKRWAFANLKGNPPASGSIETMKGLEDNFKVLFLRLHNTDEQVTSAEGYIRGTQLAGKASAKGVPVPLDAKLKSAAEITWTPIQQSGWVNLIITPKDPSFSKSLFRLDNILGGIFHARADSIQSWHDPKDGTTPTGLTSSSIKKFDVVIAFIGTTVDVPVPQQGADNSAFLDVASEIRMVQL